MRMVSGTGPGDTPYSYIYGFTGFILYALYEPRSDVCVTGRPRPSCFPCVGWQRRTAAHAHSSAAARALAALSQLGVRSRA